MIAAADDMRGAFTTSFVLHGLILAVIVLGLPRMKPPVLELSQPIAVDIVDLGPVTTTQVQGTGQIAKQNDNAPAPASPPPAAEPAKPNPMTDAPKAKVDERKALEDIIGSEIKKLPADKNKPKAEDKPDPAQFSSLLKNLSQVKNQPSTTGPAVKKADGPAAGAPGIQSDKLTISQEDALRRQIEQCWNVPSGARDAQDMVVEIHVTVNPDRTVKAAEIVSNIPADDPFFRAAAESAKRAILNPKCSPLLLPEDRYDSWKEMTLRFNPKDVL